MRINRKNVSIEKNLLGFSAETNSSAFIEINKLTELWGVFGNDLGRRKLVDTVIDLIDMRKKIRIFCIEK
jgi:hypothetical protein